MSRDTVTEYLQNGWVRNTVYEQTTSTTIYSKAADRPATNAELRAMSGEPPPQGIVAELALDEAVRAGLVSKVIADDVRQQMRNTGLKASEICGACSPRTMQEATEPTALVRFLSARGA